MKEIFLIENVFYKGYWREKKIMNKNGIILMYSILNW